jgi:hypothetical protein
MNVMKHSFPGMNTNEMLHKNINMNNTLSKLEAYPASYLMLSNILGLRLSPYDKIARVENMTYAIKQNVMEIPTALRPFLLFFSCMELLCHWVNIG